MPAHGEEAPGLAQLLSPESIAIDLAKEERADVIKALLSSLVAAGRLTKANSTAAAKGIAEREALGSTAIGGGVALPHARVAFAKKPILALAALRAGTGFKPLDGAPVRWVFLLLTRQDEDETHVAILRAITRFVRDPIRNKALSSCRTPAEIHAVIKDYA